MNYKTFNLSQKLGKKWIRAISQRLVSVEHDDGETRWYIDQPAYKNTGKTVFLTLEQLQALWWGSLFIETFGETFKVRGERNQSYESFVIHDKSNWEY